MVRPREKPPKANKPKAERVHSIASAIEKAMLSDTPPVDIHDLACEWMNLCGGPKGFAKIMFDELTGLPPGSAGRVRLLDIGARLWTIATNPHSGGDLGFMTEADLERAAGNLMVRIGVQSRDQVDLERDISKMRKRMESMVVWKGEWIDHACI